MNTAVTNIAVVLDFGLVGLVFSLLFVDPL